MIPSYAISRLRNGAAPKSDELQAVLSGAHIDKRPFFVMKRAGQRFSAVAAFAGSANAQIAAPWSGGLSISGTRAEYARDCEPPGPTTVATYSRPLTEYAIGTEAGTSFRRIFHSSAPVAASCALNIRSRPPTNTSPPAVARTPDVSGALLRSTQTVRFVSRLTASRCPYFPSLPGLGRTFQRTPVVRLPRSPSATGTRSMHASTIGMKSILVDGSYDVGIQSRPPSTCGQIVLISPSPGTSLASTVLAPVFGSIPVTTFCSPHSLPTSMDPTYLPVAVSRMSQIICLPAVTTTLFGTLFTVSCITCRSNAQSRSHWPFVWC